MKKMLCILLALATLLTSGLTTSALGAGQDHTSFDDLRDTRWSWAWPTIDAAIDYGFFVGYEPYRDRRGNLITNFGPADAVTEAVGLILCARMVSTQEDRASILTARLEQMRDIIPGTASDPDDPRAPYAWFRPEAAACLEFGIISEHDLIALRDGDRLGSSMSKADFAKYLIRAAGLEDYAKTLQYNDLPFADASAIAQEYRPYVKLLSAYGVLTGDEAGNFNPNQGMNRAVCATMLARTVQNIVNNDSLMEHAGQSTTDSYVVYFDANGAAAVYPSSMVVENGMRYGALPTPSRDGYAFDGWYTEPSGGYRVSASDTVELTRDQTVYAHWISDPAPEETDEDHEPETGLTTDPAEASTPKMFTVFFDAQGGTASPAQKALSEDETYDALPTPTRAGYTFEGWYTASSGGWKIEKIVKLTADTTLYAHWTKEPDIQPICTTHTRGEYRTFEANHPHHSIYLCAVCGEQYADRSTSTYYDKCEICNPAPTTPVKTDGTYYSVKNKATGKVLNVYYNRSANGTNVDIYDMDYTDSVYWKFTKSGSGYVLSPRNATGSALNVYSDTKGYNGCNVCIWTKTGHSTQNWVVEAVSGGYILRSASNTSLVLTANGNGNNSNVDVQTYKEGNNYQVWNFTESGATAGGSETEKPTGGGSDKKGSDYASGALAARLDHIINVGIDEGVSPSLPKVGDSMSKSTKFTTTWKKSGDTTAAWTCMAYAQGAYNYLFGCRYGDDRYNTHFTQAESTKDFTYSNFQSWGVKCGAYMRITPWYGNDGHSFIILDYNSGGVTTLEGNYDGNGKIGIRYHPWSDFNKKFKSGSSLWFVQPTQAVYDAVQYP